MDDLGREELVESVELVRVSAERRRERSGAASSAGFDRSHLHLQLPAEALDPSGNVNGVALPKAMVEEIDVVPDSRLDASARVSELEVEVRSAGSSAPRSSS